MSSGHNWLRAESGAPYRMNDPGSAGVISAVRSAVMALESNVATTRTVAAPVFEGQRLMLHATTNLTTTNQVTFSAAINAAGNTAIASGNSASIAQFIGVHNGTAMVWRLVANQGYTLA